MVALALVLVGLIALIILALWLFPKWWEAREDRRKIRAETRMRRQITSSPSTISIKSIPADGSIRQDCGPKGRHRLT